MTALSADRPSTDPTEDLFGHAPFAKSLADSICRYPGSDGLVLALYGPWGSGKSTVLSYVRHYLEQRPEQERPIVVPFNPWWFSGQEHLARAFFDQLQAVLPKKSEKLRALGDLFGELAEGIGGLIDLSGYSFGGGAIIGKILGGLKRKPKDVPALKEKIAKVLKDAHQRILVLIDDIDRLTPEEVRQLFTVIKALGDFPNVVYLLAFDRAVAVDAIEQQTGLPGDRFLEKIIQVPFEIPPVDQATLREALSRRLNEVMAGTPDGMFDESYWASVSWEGIYPLIHVPRDVVRFTNTLSVTYASVVGELNPVDFVAIEALRVFAPVAYDAVRSNPGKFTSSRSSATSANSDEEFHHAWQERMPEGRLSAANALLRSIFPKLSAYSPSWSDEWRKSLRLCVPEYFPTYFRLSVPPGVIGRSEMLELIALGSDPKRLGEVLLAAAREKRPDGSSRARALIHRLMDYVENEIPGEYVGNYIRVLLDVGDQLVLPADANQSADFGIRFRTQDLVYELMKRIASGERRVLIREAYTQGKALALQAHLLPHLVYGVDTQTRGEDRAVVDAATLDELKAITLGKIRAEGDGLLNNSMLNTLLHTWMEFGDANEVLSWCAQVTSTEQGLLRFLSHFLKHGERRDDQGVRRIARLSPKRIGKYIEVEPVEQRLRAMIEAGQVPEAAQEAVTEFLLECSLIRAGANPDDIFAFDD